MKSLPTLLVSCLGALILWSSHSVAEDLDGQSALRTAANSAIKIVPLTQPASGFDVPGVSGLFFDSVSWHGKPTRVFAWIGFPPDLKPGQKVPAVVLVHGGGGTAFAQWVRLWTARGYAAIAPDTCGQVPRKPANEKSWDRDSQGGPAGWGGFEQVDDPPVDQWPYHAALDVILANSLIRSLPQVDSARVGIVGISWGGYLTCICAGLDDRFAFAIPVYGCGYLGEDSAWLPNLQQIGPEKSARWLKAWDPAQYLPDATMPMLWVDGTNDANYPLDSLQRSYLLPAGKRTLATRVGMKHSHSAGWAPEEIQAFADSIRNIADPLPQITGQGVDGATAWASYESKTPLSKAELNYTRDEGPWKDRKWQTLPATIEPEGKVSAQLPLGTAVHFFNLTDSRDLLVSSEHQRAPRVVLGYYSSDQPDCFRSLTTYGSGLNAVSVDAFLLGKKGSLTGDVPQNVLAFTRAKRLAAYACVSNENWDPKIAHQSITTYRTEFVASLLKLAADNGFSGVNIDLEGLDAAGRTAFTQFVQVLAKALHEQNMRLVVSVPAKSADDPQDSWTGAFDYSALGREADWIQVMTYDENVSGWDPGPVAGIGWVTRSIQYAVRQIHPSKILLGLPAYGRDWSLKTKKSTDVRWVDMPVLMRDHRAKPTWDIDAGSIFFDYSINGNEHRVWCENDQSIQLKIALVNEFKLGGVSIWALGMEDQAFRDAVSKGLLNRGDKEWAKDISPAAK